MVGGFLYLVAAVPEHYLLGLSLVEPAATTVAQELQRLSEELMVVGHTTCVDGCCFVFHGFMCVFVCGYSVTAARACDNIYAVMIVLLSGNSFTG